MNGDSWVGSMLQEFHDIVPLVAQGYADNFDLESLLKLQRNYATHFMRSANMRSSTNRKTYLNATVLNNELPLSFIDPRRMHGLGANQIDQFDRKKIMKWKYKWRDNLRSILKETGKRTMARNLHLGRNFNNSEDFASFENDPVSENDPISEYDAIYDTAELETTTKVPETLPIAAIESAQIRTSANPDIPNPTVPGPDLENSDDLDEDLGYESEEIDDEMADLSQIMNEDPVFCPWYMNNDYHEPTNQDRFKTRFFVRL